MYFQKSLLTAFSWLKFETEREEARRDVGNCRKGETSMDYGYTPGAFIGDLITCTSARVSNESSGFMGFYWSYILEMFLGKPQSVLRALEYGVHGQSSPRVPLLQELFSSTGTWLRNFLLQCFSIVVDLQGSYPPISHLSFSTQFSFFPLLARSSLDLASFQLDFSLNR